MDTLAGEENALARAAAAAEAEQAQLERQMTETEARIGAIDEDFRQVLGRWRKSGAGEEELSEEPTPALAELLVGRLREAAETLTEIVAREGAGRALLRRLEGARRDFEGQRRLCEELQEQLTAQRQALLMTAGTQETAKAAQLAAGRACDEAVAQLAEPLGAAAGWEPVLKRDPQGFHAACRQRAEAWQRQDRRRKDVADDLQKLAPELAAGEEKLRQAQGQVERLQQKVTASRTGWERLQQDRQLFFAGEAASAVEKRLQGKEAAARQSLETVRGGLQDSAAKIGSCQSERRSVAERTCCVVNSCGTRSAPACRQP